MKIVTIVGARPQFIKASAFARAVAMSEGVEEIILHTGQHYDHGMSEVFFEELGIAAPKYNLDIGNLPHGAMTGRQIEGIEKVLIDEKPDFVLVYGDTNSTLAGGLAAAKLHIPVAHVEAGLRSFNRRMPEEINRILTDHLSSQLFAPTALAVENLAKEGIAGATVHNVGDIMYDVALYFAAKARAESGVLERLDLGGGEYVIATIHRSESTDDPERLSSIFKALARLSEERAVVLPLHPRTRKMLSQAGLLDAAEKALKLIPPVGYLDMTELVRNAALVVTDSGGLQKEAFFHGRPCVTLRDETEWVELVDLGVNRLPADFAAETLYRCFTEMVRLRRLPAAIPYGTGDTAAKILRILQSD